MRINQVIAVVLGLLLMSGYGDQVWKGEIGRGSNRDVSTSTALIDI